MPTLISADPTEFANRIVKAMVADFQKPMESLGKDMQSEIRQLISVPVQYVPSGSSRPAKPKPIGSKPGPGLTQRAGLGQAVIRSKRGEPPRKEFGILYKSMTTSTQVQGNRIVTEMGSDDSIAGYSARLEQRMDRPHFRTIFERVQSYAVGRLLSRLPNNF